MGKASSAKKVARVARSSGGPTRERPKLGFPAAIVGIVVVGVLMVGWARTTTDSASAAPPTLSDHWHAAYGIYVCGEFLPSLTDVFDDTTGIHTHDDGIVHVHPFSSAATGDNATWSTFGEVVDVSFDGSSFTLADGTTYEDGYDCDGEPATVSMHQWPADDPDAEAIVTTEDIGSVRFSEDRLAFTLAVVPEGTEVPRPPSVPTLDDLSDLEEEPEPGEPPTEATSPDPALQGEPSDASSTTVAPEGAADEPSDASTTTSAPADGADAP